MSFDALSQSKPTRRRRFYTPEFKQSVIAEILETRQSISSVSLRIGVNDNIVRRWMTDHLKATGAYQVPPQFVPILCDHSDANFSGPASTSAKAPVENKVAISDTLPATVETDARSALVGSLRLQTSSASLELQGAFDRDMLAILLARVLP